MNTLIFVRGIGFLFYNNIRMRHHKVFIDYVFNAKVSLEKLQDSKEYAA